MEKYPGRYPVICEVSKELPDLDKHKYLVPRNITVAQLLYVIRQRVNSLNSEKALYLSIKNTLITSQTRLCDVYDQYKDEDGFLYFSVYSENTFG